MIIDAVCPHDIIAYVYSVYSKYRLYEKVVKALIAITKKNTIFFS